MTIDNDTLIYCGGQECYREIDYMSSCPIAHGIKIGHLKLDPIRGASRDYLIDSLEKFYMGTTKSRCLLFSGLAKLGVQLEVCRELRDAV